VSGQISLSVLFLTILNNKAIKNTNEILLFLFVLRLLDGYQVANSCAFILDNTTDQTKCIGSQLFLSLDFLNNREESAEKLFSLLFVTKEFSLLLLIKSDKLFQVASGTLVDESILFVRSDLLPVDRGI